MAWLRTVTTLASGVVFCASAHAQTLGGVVRDAASHHPVAGAVVQLIDSAGRVVTRRLTDSSGMYQLTLAGRSARIDVRRMGFRPFEKTLPPLRENATLDVALIRLATLLEAVRVSDQPSCPRRRDRAAALALWQQARTGLLASVASGSGRNVMAPTPQVSTSRRSTERVLWRAP